MTLQSVEVPAISTPPFSCSGPLTSGSMLRMLPRRKLTPEFFAKSQLILVQL